jgi:hypothetical protein
MKPAGHERHKEHSQDEELQGLAARSLREGIPVDELELREADAKRVDELRAGAKEKLLAMAGYTTGKAVAELSPAPEKAKGIEGELSPEQVEKKWLGEFKSRFDALPKLHEGVQWTDVETSLRADPESMAKLQALDAKGHAMNVFGEESGEFIFVSAWGKEEQVAPNHRNIAYDTKGQKLSEKKGCKPKGNAVSIIANIMGVKHGVKMEEEASNYLADPKFHEQLIEEIAVNGVAWLKTDADTRKTGFALRGRGGDGIFKMEADYSSGGSFRAALRVKKA